MAKTLVITGPPGAGKSTAGEAFAQGAQSTWAHIEQDQIRRQVKAGYKSASGQPWDDEIQRQWDLSIDICSDMALRYREAGVHHLIDCFAPPHMLSRWQSRLQAIEYDFVVMLPDVEVAVARNSLRIGEACLSETEVRQSYEWFEEYRSNPQASIIDSSTLSIQGIGQALAAIVDRS